MSKSPTDHKLQRWMIAIAPLAAGVIMALHLTGFLQGWEWFVLDRFFRWRPEETIDKRITVVTIDDADITKLQRWPVPDQELANALKRLIAMNPRVIALDLYRDLPVEPGHAELNRLFKTTPNLIGVEKRFGQSRVPPPPSLAEVNQVALADVVPDKDGIVRRALLSATDPKTGDDFLGLASMVALYYLSEQKIEPQYLNDRMGSVVLGRSTIRMFQCYDGAYVRADDQGYQILLNYRKPVTGFQQVSLTDILEGQVPETLIRNRIIFIGSIAESTKDYLPTPLSDLDVLGGTAGVLIHANVASLLISAALDGRPLLRGFPLPLTALWIVTWSSLGVLVMSFLLNQPRKGLYIKVGAGYLLLVISLISTGYGLFLCLWWGPVIAPLLSLTLASVISIGLHIQSLSQLAYTDGLTQLYNRLYLEQEMDKLLMLKGDLAIILCDIDYFKFYNDTYGHLAGDLCLQKVARAIRQAVRPYDVVVRYGGEEIAILLQANQSKAIQIAQRVVDQVRNLQLPHANSKACPYVTLSCGVAAFFIEKPDRKQLESLAKTLLHRADVALYTAKIGGRNCARIAIPESLDASDLSSTLDLSSTPDLSTTPDTSDTSDLST